MTLAYILRTSYKEETQSSKKLQVEPMRLKGGLSSGCKSLGFKLQDSGFEFAVSLGLGFTA